LNLLKFVASWEKKLLLGPRFLGFRSSIKSEDLRKEQKIDRLQWILETVTCAIQSRDEVQKEVIYMVDFNPGVWLSPGAPLSHLMNL
jgi:hypothetical protein